MEKVDLLIQFLKTGGGEQPQDPEYINSLIGATGDYLNVFVLILAIGFCALSFLLWSKFKKTTNANLDYSNHVQTKSSLMLYKVSMVLCVTISALLFVFGIFTNFVQAKAEEPKDSQVVYAYINVDDASITFDKAYIKNETEGILYFTNSSALAKSSVEAINDSNFTVEGLNGVLFEGKPDGSQFVIKDVLDPLPVSEKAEISFSLTGLTSEEILALPDNTSIEISLGSEKLVENEPEVIEDLTYNGEEQLGVTEGEGYEVINGRRTNAGNYVATALLKPGFLWQDGSSQPREFEFSIAKRDLALNAEVSLSSKVLVYTGDEIGPKISVVDKLNDKNILDQFVDVAFEGDKATDIGSHQTIVKATEEGNYFGEITNIDWGIYEAIDIPEANTYTYDGTNHRGVAPSEDKYDIEGDNEATDAGNYQVKLIIKGFRVWKNIDGPEINLNWIINQRSISNVKAEFVGSSDVYFEGVETGPEYKVSDIGGDDILDEENDLDITGTTSSELGEHTINITSKNSGNYTGGPITLNWKLFKKVDEPTVYTNLVYDGSVKRGFDVGKGYTIIDGANQGTNAGSYNAVLHLDPFYRWNTETEEDKNITWEINRRKLSNAKIVITPSEVEYLGSSTGPSEIKLIDELEEGKSIISPSDYSATGELTSDVLGNHEIQFISNTMSGNYVDDPEKPLKTKWLLYKLIDNPTTNTLTYTGTQQVGVNAGVGYTLTDYTGVSKGSYTAHATTEDFYRWKTTGASGTIDIPWSIASYDISKGSPFTYTVTNPTYTAVAIKPTVKASFGSTELTIDEHFTVICDPKKDVDSQGYTLTIKACEDSDYTGEITDVFWNIEPQIIDTSKFIVTTSPLVYDANQHALGDDVSLTVVGPGETLTLNKDFTLSGSLSETNANQNSQFSIIGKGNYKSSIDSTWNITPFDISTNIANKFKYTIDSLVFNNQNLSPSVHVSFDDASYDTSVCVDVSCTSQVNAGTYDNLTLTGKNNFSGSISNIQWIISPKSLSGSDIVLTTNQVTYNSLEKSLLEDARLLVRDNSTTQQLVHGTDYEITSGAVATDAHQNISYTISGKGNYSGQKSDYWTINPLDITDYSEKITPKFSDETQKIIYNNEPHKVDVVELQIKLSVALSLNLNNQSFDYDCDQKIDVPDPGSHYTYLVTGKGNYCGTYTGTWDIHPKPIDKIEIYGNESINTYIEGKTYELTSGYIAHAYNVDEDGYNEIEYFKPEKMSPAPDDESFHLTRSDPGITSVDLTTFNFKLLDKNFSIEDNKIVIVKAKEQLIVNPEESLQVSVTYDSTSDSDGYKLGDTVNYHIEVKNTGFDEDSDIKSPITVQTFILKTDADEFYTFTINEGLEHQHVWTSDPLPCKVREYDFNADLDPSCTKLVTASYVKSEQEYRFEGSCKVPLTRTAVTKPEESTSVENPKIFTYNGQTQGYDDNEYYTITKDAKMKNANSNPSYYTAQASLNTNAYCWDDDSRDPLTIYWKIIPANLTVTAESKQIKYGESAGTYSVTYNGLMEDLDYSDINKSGLTYNVDYVPFDASCGNVGKYDIVPSGLISTNYSISYVKGSLDVQKKAVELIWPEHEDVQVRLPNIDAHTAPTATVKNPYPAHIEPEENLKIKEYSFYEYKSGEWKTVSSTSAINENNPAYKVEAVEPINSNFVIEEPERVNNCCEYLIYQSYFDLTYEIDDASSNFGDIYVDGVKIEESSITFEKIDLNSELSWYMTNVVNDQHFVETTLNVSFKHWNESANTNKEIKAVANPDYHFNVWKQDSAKISNTDSYKVTSDNIFIGSFSANSDCIGVDLEETNSKIYPASITIGEEKELYLNSHTNYSLSEQGVISFDTSHIELYALPMDKYVFVYWGKQTIDEGDIKREVLYPTVASYELKENTTLYAVSEPNNGPYMVSPSVVSVDGQSGATFSLTNSEFDDTVSPPAFRVFFDSDQTIHLRDPQYFVNSEQPNVLHLDTCTGLEVTLTANCDNESEFYGWYLIDEYGKEILIEPDAQSKEFRRDISVKAKVYKKDTIPVSAELIGGGSGKIIASTDSEGAYPAPLPLMVFPGYKYNISDNVVTIKDSNDEPKYYIKVLPDDSSEFKGWDPSTAEAEITSSINFRAIVSFKAGETWPVKFDTFGDGHGYISGVSDEIPEEVPRGSEAKVDSTDNTQLIISYGDGYVRKIKATEEISSKFGAWCYKHNDEIVEIPENGIIIDAYTEFYARFDKAAKAVLYNNGTLKFYYDANVYNDPSIESTYLVANSYALAVDVPWKIKAEKVKSVSIDNSFEGFTALSSTAYWFNGFINATSFTNLGKLPTKNVEDMTEMFASCTQLKTFTFDFDTSSATTLTSMFSGCTSLESFNASNFKSDEVLSINNMFGGDTKLATITFADNKWNANLGLAGLDSTKWLNSAGNVFDPANFPSATSGYGKFTLADKHIDFKVSPVGAGSFDNTESIYFNSIHPASWSYSMEDWGKIKFYVKSEDLSNSVEYTKTVTASTGYELNKWGDLNTTSGNITASETLVDAQFSNEKTFKAIRTKDSNNKYTLTYLYNARDYSYLNTPGEGSDNYWDNLSLNADEASDWGYNNFRNSINKVVFDESISSTTGLTSTAYMMYDMNNLSSIEGIDNIKNNSISSASNMFRNCGSITSLDLSSLAVAFNNSNKDYSYLFSGCSKLTTLNISGWTAQSSENLSYMFSGCSKLSAVDVSLFNTAVVSNYSYMFNDCSALGQLDLSSFSTNTALNFDSMFANCVLLTTINASQNFVVSGGSSSNGMFSGCAKLVGGNGTQCSVEQVYTGARAVLDTAGEKDSSGTDAPKGYFTAKPSKVKWGADSNIASVKQGEAIVVNDSNLINHGSKLTVVPSTTNSYTFKFSHELYGKTYSYTSPLVIANKTFEFNMPASTVSLYIEPLQEITITANANNSKAGSFIYKDSSGNPVDVLSVQQGTQWEINEDKIVEFMLEGAFVGSLEYALNSGFDFSSWNTPSTQTIVDNASATFTGIFKSKFNAYVVKNSAEDTYTLDFRYGDSKPDTYVESFELPYDASSSSEWLYKGSSNINSINKVVFDSSVANNNVLTSSAYMFSGMNKITSIQGLENLNNSNIVDATSMFDGCSLLSNADIGKLQLSQCYKFGSIFKNCSSLSEIDISGFDLSSIDASKTIQLESMFYFTNTNNELSKIIVSEDFDTSKSSSSANMFYNCVNLKGANNTTYTDDKSRDKTLALIDTAGEKKSDESNAPQGYFTGKASTVNWGNNITSVKIKDGEVVEKDKTPVPHGAVLEITVNANKLPYSIFVSHSVYGNIYNHSTAKRMPYQNCEVSMPGTNVTLTFENTDAFTISGLGANSKYKMVDPEGAEKTDWTVPYGTTWEVNENQIDFKFKESEASTISLGSLVAIKNGYYDFSSWKDVSITGTIDSADKAQFSSVYYEIQLKALLPKAGSTDKTLTFAYDNVQYSTDTYQSFVLFDNTSKASSFGYTQDAYKETFSTVEFKETVDNFEGFVDMSSMFKGCTKLSTIKNISYLDTSKATNMSSMFESCGSLTSIDLSTFTTSGVTNMASMFATCSQLTTIFASDSFDVSNVTSSANMFASCNELKGGNGTEYNADAINANYARLDTAGEFDESENAAPAGYFTSLNATVSCSTTEYDVYADGTKISSTDKVSHSSIITVKPSNAVASSFVVVASHTVGDVAYHKYAYCYNNVVSSEFIKGAGNVSLSIEGLYNVFASASGATGSPSFVFKDATGATVSSLSVLKHSAWSVDISSPNTINFSFTYPGESTSIPLGSVTANNTDADFFSCWNLEGNTGIVNNAEDVNLLATYKQSRTLKAYDTGTKSTTNAESDFTLHMIYNAIDYSKFNFTSYTIQLNTPARSSADNRAYKDNANYYDCVDIDASCQNAGELTSTSMMFANFDKCSDFKNLNNLNTSNVTCMDNTFAQCKAVSEYTSMFTDTSKVTSFYGMFSSNNNLEKFEAANLPIVSAATTDIEAMFSLEKSTTSKITSLDLSKWTTTNVTKFGSLFQNQASIECVYVSDNFVITASGATSNNMFNNCTSIVGGDGFKFDDTKTDKTYAKADAQENHGYFTYKHVGAIDDSCELNYDANGGSTITFTQTVKQGSSFTVQGASNNIDIPTKADYVFIGWNSLQDGSGNWYYAGEEYPSTGSLTVKLYAQWSSQTGPYTVKAAAEVAGTLNFTYHDASGTQKDYITVNNGNTWKINVSNPHRIDFYNSNTLIGYVLVSDTSTKAFTYWKNKESYTGTINSAIDAFFLGTTADAGLETFKAIYDAETNSTLTFTSDAIDYSKLGYENVYVDLPTDIVDDSKTWPYSDKVGSVQHVVINNNVSNVSFTGLYSMFSGMTNLEDISGLNYINTNNVTVLGSMFANCSSLKSLDLSSWQFSGNYHDIKAMFNGCSGLESLKLFNISITSDFYNTFQGCSKLEIIDISGFDTTAASSNISISNLFKGCNSLKTIYASDKLDYSKFTTAQSVFEGCTNLVGGNGTVFSSTYVTASRCAPDCKEKSAYLTYKSTTDERHLRYDPNYAGGVMLDYYQTVKQGNSFTVGGEGAQAVPVKAGSTFGGWNTAKDGSGTWYYNKTSDYVDYIQAGTSDITLYAQWGFNIDAKTNDSTHSSVIIKDGSGQQVSSLMVEKGTTWQIDNSTNNITLKVDSNTVGTIEQKVNDSDAADYGFINWKGADDQVKANSGTIEFATDAVFTAIFSQKTLKAIDSNNHTKLTIYYDQFDHATEGTLYNLETDKHTTHSSQNWKYSSIAGYVTTVIIDSSVGEDNGITRCDYMFSNFTSLREISGLNYLFNTANDTTKPISGATITYIFSECKSLEQINVENMVNTCVSNTWRCFNACEKLKNVDVSTWAFDNCTKVSRMFEGCTAITDIKFGICNFSKASDMGGNFHNCSSLEELDLSGWDFSGLTAKVTPNEWFAGCSKLKKIYISYKGDISNKLSSTTPTTPFLNCNNLIGGNGTTFTNDSISNAKIDKADSGNAGYFTYKAYPGETDDACKITYNPNYGSGEDYDFTQQVKINDNFTVGGSSDNMKDLLNRGDIKFFGWNTKPDGTGDTYQHQSSVKATGNSLKLYAQWGVEVTAQSNDTNMGSVTLKNATGSSVSSLSVKSGTTWTVDSATNNITLKTDGSTVGTIEQSPKSSDYDFVGWSGIQSSGSITSNTKFVATFAAKTYKAIAKDNKTKVIVYYDAFSHDGEGTVVSPLPLNPTASTSWDSSGWSGLKTTAKSVEFDPSVHDISNLQSLCCMFKEWSKLETVSGLNYINMNKVTTVQDMFHSCSNLKDFDVFLNANEMKVQDMRGMFLGCDALTKFDFKMNTSSCTQLWSTFENMDNLEVLDFTSWDTSKVTSINYFVNECPKLKTIYVGDNFIIKTSPSSSNHFFGNNRDLCGGNGLKWDNNKNTSTYAKAGDYDTDGLLTYKGDDACKLSYDLNYSGADQIAFTQQVKQGKSFRVGGAGGQVPDPTREGFEFKGWTTNKEGTGTVYQTDSALLASGSTMTLYAQWGPPKAMFITGTNFNSKLATIVSGATSFLHFDGTPTAAQLSNALVVSETGKKGYSGTIWIWKETPTNEETVIYWWSDVSIVELNADASKMFYGRTEFKNVIDLRQIDPSNTTKLNNMFENCYYINSINVSDWRDNTQNVTTLNRMFWVRKTEGQASSLVNIEGIEDFNTSSVTDMGGIFCGCAFERINLSKWNTSKCTIFGNLFNSCEKLKDVNVSFDTSKGNGFGAVFKYCKSLETVDLSSWSKGNLTDGVNQMFYNDVSLKTIYTNKDFSLVGVSGTPFGNCTDKLVGGNGTIFSTTGASNGRVDYHEHSGYFTYKAKPDSTTDDACKLTYDLNYTGAETITFTQQVQQGMSFTVANNDQVKNPTRDGFEFKGWTTNKEGTGTVYQKDSAITASGNTMTLYAKWAEKTFKSVLASDGTMTFYYDALSHSGEGTLYNNLTYSASSSSSWGYNSVRSQVKKVVMSASMRDLTKLTSTNNMFTSMTNLESVDLANLNTSNVTNMGWMFLTCSKITSIDLSNFDTQKVTVMQSVFQQCSAVTDLDLSNFNTSKVTTMEAMFAHCYALKTLKVSNFNTEKLQKMGYWVFNCYELTELDLSSFSNISITDLKQAFYQCSKLQTIYASPATWTDKKLTSSDTFKGCSSSLVGRGKDSTSTTWDNTHINAEYARVQHGDSSNTPGYFTDSSLKTGIKDSYKVDEDSLLSSQSDDKADYTENPEEISGASDPSEEPQPEDTNTDAIVEESNNTKRNNLVD